MKIIDGVAYPDSFKAEIRVKSISVLDNYVLEVTFNNEEVKHFDFSKMFDFPVFQPLKDKSLFSQIVIDHGVPTWLGGEIDISPAKLYFS